MSTQSLLNTKTSFSKKEVRLIAEEFNLDLFEVERALSTIPKTMLGKELVLDTLVVVGITINEDECGLKYTPDQLIVDINAKLVTPTFSGPALQAVIKEIWSNVSPVLHQHPKGHALIKELIITLNKELCGKPNTGVKQVRELVKMKALELYSQI